MSYNLASEKVSEAANSVGERAPLDRVFSLGPFAWGGDVNTIGQAGAEGIIAEIQENAKDPQNAILTETDNS